jgi:eukaryotic-like serine/threonine-protein kinase
MANAESKCSRCGAAWWGGGVSGMCPVCLLRGSLATEEAGEWEACSADLFALEAAGLAHAGPWHGTERLADYRIESEVGRGGMGIVYRAHQLSLNRTVALKMIRAGPLSSADLARRLRMEAQATAALDHPNILSIYEVGEHNGQPFYTMRLVEGSNLAQVLESGPLEPHRAAVLMARVARAIQHAHERGVAHGDLKPSNILLDSQGHPHVTDFGLATLLHAGRPVPAEDPMGTPSYVAPEVISDDEHRLTTAADIYGLGAILYELLTGRPVFRAETPLEVIRRVLQRTPEPPTDIIPGLSRDLEAVCLKCLNKVPENRYASAAAVASDLDSWLASRPIAGRRVGWAGRFRLWCRRSRRQTGLRLAA